MMSNYRITEQDAEKIKRYTPFAMPNSPSERGMGPDAIKAFFWKYLDALFKVLNDKYGLIENSQKAYEFRNIVYAKYIAPDGYLLNSKVKDLQHYCENANGEQITDGLERKGDFTKDTMTAYLNDTHLSNPVEGENADLLFFQNQTNTKTKQAGFIIEFNDELDIGIVQMYIWSVWEGTTMKAYVSNDKAIWEQADTLTFIKVPTTNTLCVYRFKICKTARYLKIVQEGDGWTNGTFAMKGIEIFEPNYEGKYQVVQKNGNVIELDTFIASSLVSEVLDYKNLAQAWAESDSIVEEKIEVDEDGKEISNTAKYSAKYWAEYAKAFYDVLCSVEGQAGSFVRLEEINGVPKIPSVYINQFDHKRHIKITNESELDTLVSSGTVQGGDIAILIETVYEVDADGNKIDGTEKEAITKTWLYYAEYDEDDTEIAGSQEWIPYGTSYSTNAGYSTYANNAGNADKINGHAIFTKINDEYNKLVEDETVNSNAIYIVEV